MTHPRQSIRYYVADLLSLKIGVVDGHVFRSRTNPLQREELPAICVHTNDEFSEQIHVNNRRLDRNLDVFVDIYARNVDNPDDEIDAIAESVESIMNEDFLMGGLAINSWLAATTAIFDGQGEKVNGASRLRYAVNYQTVP